MTRKGWSGFIRVEGGGESHRKLNEAQLKKVIKWALDVADSYVQGFGPDESYPVILSLSDADHYMRAVDIGYDKKTYTWKVNGQSYNDTDDEVEKHIFDLITQPQMEGGY